VPLGSAYSSVTAVTDDDDAAFDRRDDAHAAAAAAPDRQLNYRSIIGAPTILASQVPRSTRPGLLPLLFLSLPHPSVRRTAVSPRFYLIWRRADFAHLRSPTCINRLHYTMLVRCLFISCSLHSAQLTSVVPVIIRVPQPIKRKKYS